MWLEGPNAAVNARRRTAAEGMPGLARHKVCQLGGSAIYVNADDHFPAHFHVRAGGKGGLAWIEIDSLAVRHTNLHRADLRMVLNWAAQRQDELRKAWEQAKAGQLPEEIPPA